VQLLPLILNGTNTISDSANQKGIELLLDIPENLEVIADIHMLQTIGRNLLSNAIKFTPAGGLIRISAYASEGNFVTISVKDTGIGIAPDMLQKIFMLDANIKTKGTEGELSTGLGLILCKEFVEKHGGKIWVESQEGKGSTFYFTVRNSKS
jgi:signal transduction histidine kinase